MPYVRRGGCKRGREGRSYHRQTAAQPVSLAFVASCLPSLPSARCCTGAEMLLTSPRGALRGGGAVSKSRGAQQPSVAIAVEQHEVLQTGPFPPPAYLRLVAPPCRLLLAAFPPAACCRFSGAAACWVAILIGTPVTDGQQCVHYLPTYLQDYFLCFCFLCRPAKLESSGPA